MEMESNEDDSRIGPFFQNYVAEWAVKAAKDCEGETLFQAYTLVYPNQGPHLPLRTVLEAL